MICFKGTVGMSLVRKWEGQFIYVFSMFRVQMRCIIPGNTKALIWEELELRNT